MSRPHGVQALEELRHALPANIKSLFGYGVALNADGSVLAVLLIFLAYAFFPSQDGAIEPAKALMVDHRVGSLEAGKRATLIVTDGHALENTSFVVHAFIDGRKIDLTNKQTELRDKYREKYKTEPEAYAVYGYEAAKVALEAIKKVNKKDRDAIREALDRPGFFVGFGLTRF